MKLAKYVPLILVVLLAVALRFFKLGEIPYGLNIDEASMGYNAYSLLLTGRDRYGQLLPILFRSFGSFQPPLYTYFTIIPLSFFGMTMFSVHFISAFSGVGVVILSYLILTLLTNKKSLAILVSLFVTIAPWTVFFSRVATEASLGIFVFLIGLFLCLYSMKENIRIFPLACLFLGLSTHAYYSERIVSLLLFVVLLYIYRKVFFKAKIWTVIGVVVIFLTQIPHIYISKTGSFVRRLDQVTYLGRDFFEDNGGSFKNIPLGRQIFVGREFLSQYVSYFSPKNLFFETDEQEARSMPDISVFYNWMVIPFFIGFGVVFRRKYLELSKVIFILLIISPIPAALAFDPFYTLRVFTLLWTLTVVITVGVYEFIGNCKNIKLGVLVLVLLVVSSLGSLYKSLFILDKYERAEVGGYSFIKLTEVIKEYPQKKFIIDSPRNLGTGIRMAFFQNIDPLVMQTHLKNKMNVAYYSGNEITENYPFENVEVRSIVWENDICVDQILVGDALTFSEDQIREHFLEKMFDIQGMTGKVVLSGYSTNPVKKCGSILKYDRHYK